MSKIIRYLQRLPSRVEHYGYNVTVKKTVVDFCRATGIPLSPQMRWKLAHDFHTQWKRQQRKHYGIVEYNHRIDTKSLEVLNEFYEVGTDFKGKIFIDVGCGTRGVLPVITAGEKYGVDPTIDRVKFPLPLCGKYYSCKAEDLPFESCYADVVSCNNTLNHVQDPEQVIREIYRVLKAEGLFLLEVFIEPRNIAHTHEFTPEKLEELVYGYFTPIRVKYERLRVRVEIDENLDGALPMRWGGVFKK